MAKTQVIGKLGEDLAVKFLMKRGYSVLDRNYRRKTGELDIVAEKENMIHFCEVKSVSHVTSGGDVHRPEDNVHIFKQKKLAKTIQLYLLDKRKSNEVPWEFSVICVFINEKDRMAHVKHIPNIVL